MWISMLAIFLEFIIVTNHMKITNNNLFLRWIETFLNNQESCIINGGVKTHYFKLEKRSLSK